MNYRLALCLFKLYNVNFNIFEFLLLNHNQILTGRQNKFFVIKSNNYNIGINSLANRLPVINNKIPLDWLNLSFDTFKVKCKKILLAV